MTARHVRTKGPRPSLLSGALCAAVALSAAFLFSWDLTGGRLMTMTTPSMCPTVCVGSLVALQPLHGNVHRGELVAFVPPGQTSVFTHRVVGVRADGSFKTQGDAESSPDPWVVSPSDVIGRVAFTVFGLGWWLRALPIVAVGTCCLFVARRVYRPRNRRSFERLFGAVVVAVPLLVLRPLISGRLIEVVPDHKHPGWLSALVVNTGLLPQSVQTAGTTSARSLPPSQVAWIDGPKGPTGTLGLHAVAALPDWGWAIVVLAVLAPAMGFVIYRALRPIEPDPPGARAANAISSEPVSIREPEATPANRTADMPASAPPRPRSPQQPPAYPPNAAYETGPAVAEATHEPLGRTTRRRARKGVGHHHP